MSQLQKTVTINAVTVGQNELANPSQQTINNSAPEDGGVDLQAGDVQILVPAGTATHVWIKAPPGSANAKTVRNLVGDSQSSTFLDWCVYPVTPGGSFWMHSAGAEPGVKLVYF